MGNKPHQPKQRNTTDYLMTTTETTMEDSAVVQETLNGEANPEPDPSLTTTDATSNDPYYPKPRGRPPFGYEWDTTVGRYKNKSDGSYFIPKRMMNASASIATNEQAIATSNTTAATPATTTPSDEKADAPAAVATVQVDDVQPNPTTTTEAPPSNNESTNIDTVTSATGPPYPKPKGRKPHNCEWDAQHGHWKNLLDGSVVVPRRQSSKAAAFAALPFPASLLYDRPQTLGP